MRADLRASRGILEGASTGRTVVDVMLHVTASNTDAATSLPNPNHPSLYHMAKCSMHSVASHELLAGTLHVDLSFSRRCR